MHPAISYHLAQARTADLRHHAQRDTLARSARRARPGQCGQAAPMLSALGRRMLAVLADRGPGVHPRRDPRRKKNQTQAEAVVALTWAASQGDLTEVRALLATGVEPGPAENDGRTEIAAPPREHAHEVVPLPRRSDNREAAV